MTVRFCQINLTPSHYCTQLSLSLVYRTGSLSVRAYNVQVVFKKTEGKMKAHIQKIQTIKALNKIEKIATRMSFIFYPTNNIINGIE